MISTTVLGVSLGFLVLSATITVVLSLVVANGRSTRRKHDRRRQWLPPVVSGARLVEWGLNVSEAVTQKLLTKRRTSDTARKVANEVLCGTQFAINHLPSMGLAEIGPDCRERSFRRIGVTAPEVLAIADMIRSDRQEAKRIHDIAEFNAERLAETGCENTSATPLACPLRTKEGGCIAGSFCPLHCRAVCHLTDELMPGNARILEDVARDLCFGIEVGVSRALDAAGLDGHVYELNDALAVALEIPDASKQWAKGRNVLANCMRDDYTAYAV